MSHLRLTDQQARVIDRLCEGDQIVALRKRRHTHFSNLIGFADGEVVHRTVLASLIEHGKLVRDGRGGVRLA